MVQPIKKNKKNIKVVKKTNKTQKRNHPEYGTSKLEEKFAREFLDRLGVVYEYQYKSEEIGRYYDFIIKIPNGGKFLIEIDGDYW